MEIRLEKITPDIVAAVKLIQGKRYICLADVLEKLNLKGPDMYQHPDQVINVSGKVAWGHRLAGRNFIEALFLDEESIFQIINQKNMESISSER